jgi:hypothetical protein
MIRLPTYSDPFYSVTYELSGERFLFDFVYNQREDSWCFNLSTEDGEGLARGIRVSTGVNLLQFVIDKRAPKGALVCEGPRDPKLYDLEENGTCRLVFV